MATNDGFQWLKALLLNEDRKDLDFCCDHQDYTEVRVPAHSLVICPQSAVFRAMLDSDNFLEGRTKTITLSTQEPRTVEYLLRYLYTKTLPDLVPFSNLVELLEVAHLYEIDELLQLCSKRLEVRLTLDVVCEVYASALLMNLTHLREACTKMIQKNIVHILLNDLHYSLNWETLPSIYCLEYCVVDEKGLASQAILRWCNWNSFSKGINIDLDDVKEWFGEVNLSESCQKSVYCQSSHSLDWVNELCLNVILSDVEILIESDTIAKFPAHSLVLNKNSEVFYKMWKDKPSDKLQITLNGVDARNVEYFLRFIYTRHFPTEMSEKNLIILLKTAHKYKVIALKDKCLTYLLARVSINNSCLFLSLATSLEIGELEDACIRTITANFDKVLRNHLHFSLNQETFFRVISRVNSTTIDKSERFELAREWRKWQACLQGNTRNGGPDEDDPVISALGKIKFSSPSANYSTKPDLKEFGYIPRETVRRIQERAPVRRLSSGMNWPPNDNNECTLPRISMSKEYELD